MRLFLAAAGVYCVIFALILICWPKQAFVYLDLGVSRHLFLLQFIGVFYFLFGLSFFFASRDPIKHWRIILMCTLKIIIVVGASLYAWVDEVFPPKLIALMVVDDVVWLVPFLMILWASIQARAGIAPIYQQPLTPEAAAKSYTLSTGETLAEASTDKTVILVFMRHFGCTFTRQILRSLAMLEEQARQHDSRLVLVHMLQSGRETSYLGAKTGVARIADPFCELYRAFGLGKGGFLELFGPRVWIRGAVAIFRGCGAGHLAGDGLQMPGVFLFRNNRILAAQPAHSAADLPDLEQLFAAGVVVE
jgi:hypothetical protein